jgi:Zn-dependent protease
MRQSIRLGTVNGIAVGANWTVLVITALIAFILGRSVLPAAMPHHATALYWAAAVPGAIAFVASLLAHELAHALVARRHGVQVRSVTLWMLGGVTQLEGEPANPRSDFAIAIAGPLTSLVLGVLLLGAGIGLGLVGGPGAVEVVATTSFWIGAMNVLLAAFNLLPGAPLDGGRILRSAIWRLRGDRATAERAATIGGKIVGGTLIVVGIGMIVLAGRLDGLWLALVGWFLTRSAGAEQRAGTVRTALDGLHVRDVMTPDPAVALAWIPIEPFVRNIAQVSRQTVFPVVAFDGRTTGVVTLDLLARVPRSQYGERVQSVAVALPAPYLATPDDLVAPLLQRPPLAGELNAVVVSDGHVVGMITVDDLNRLVRLRGMLHTAPRRADADMHGVPVGVEDAG